MQSFYLRIPQSHIARIQTDEKLIRRVTMPPPVAVEPIEVPWWLRFVMWTVNPEGSREMDRAAAAREGRTINDPGWEKLGAGAAFRAFEWVLAELETEALNGVTTHGGVAVGIDLGLGRARFVSPERVAETAEALRTLPVRQFLSAFDPERMDREEIYPGGFHGESGRWQADLTGLLAKLRDFYHRSAEQRDGILIWID